MGHLGRIKLTMDQLEHGMLVVLTHPDPEYALGFSNPVYPNNGWCVGVVDAIYDVEVEVYWEDNGTSNTYKDWELSEWIVDDDLPEGNFESIW
jgi:hypothetical protein